MYHSILLELTDVLFRQVSHNVMLYYAYLNKIPYHCLTKQNQETMNATKNITLSVAVLA